jgi:hypothetical protein
MQDIDIPDSKNAGAMEKNEQGEQYMKVCASSIVQDHAEHKLSESRRLTVRTYNKKVLVDMREVCSFCHLGVRKRLMVSITKTRRRGSRSLDQRGFH